MASKGNMSLADISRSAGIAGLALSILLVFLPFGGYATPVVGILAMFTRKGGEMLGVAAVVISFVNILALSPILYLAAKSGYNVSEWSSVIIWIALMMWQGWVGYWLYFVNERPKPLIRGPS